MMMKNLTNLNHLAMLLTLLWLAYFSACSIKHSAEKKQTSGDVLHKNLCPDGQSWALIHVDTNRTKALSLMKTIKKIPKSNFTLFALEEEQLIGYEGLLLNEKRYIADSIEICFLRRMDIAEVDSFPNSQAMLCFNSTEDSLATFDNDTQLLVKLSLSKFITLHPDMIGVDIITVAQTGPYLLVGTYVPASSGTAANYIHMYIFETNHNHTITLYRDLSWKIQEIQWMK